MCNCQLPGQNRAESTARSGNGRAEPSGCGTGGNGSSKPTAGVASPEKGATERENRQRPAVGDAVGLRWRGGGRSRRHGCRSDPVREGRPAGAVSRGSVGHAYRGSVVVCRVVGLRDDGTSRNARTSHKWRKSFTAGVASKGVIAMKRLSRGVRPGSRTAGLLIDRSSGASAPVPTDKHDDSTQTYRSSTAQ